MRNFYFILGLFVSTLIYAQPHAFKYQAVVRDASGELLVNQTVSFQITILEGDVNGSEVYVEEHTATTSSYGSVTLEIGWGENASTDFSAIDWGSSSYFIQIAWDLTGGTNYEVAGTSQLLSVPYALYAGRVYEKVKPDVQTTNYSVQESFCGGQLYSINLTVAGVTYEYLGADTYVIEIEKEGQIIYHENKLVKWSNNEAKPSLIFEPGALLSDGDNITVKYRYEGATFNAYLNLERTLVDECAAVVEICDNGIDDDGDGFTDDEDDDCVVSCELLSDTDCPEGQRLDLATCSCYTVEECVDDAACGQGYECLDGKCTKRIEICDNGIDDDGDGFTDDEDDDCVVSCELLSDTDCPEGQRLDLATCSCYTVEECVDDAACGQGYECLDGKCTKRIEICDNGIDDDGDGFTDDEDDDCMVSNAANLSIVEVYYDAPGADEVEWVKIYNNENVAVDLSNYSFGSGGSDYTYFKTQLSGVIQPKSCFVFGKGAGDSLHYDLGINSITIQNGGVEADGVALFYGASSTINAAAIPINAVLFGAPNSNTNNLLGTDGNPAEVLAPDVTQGRSIYFDSSQGWIENVNPDVTECLGQ